MIESRRKVTPELLKKMISIWNKFPTYESLGKELGIDGVTVRRWRDRLKKAGKADLPLKSKDVADILDEI